MVAAMSNNDEANTNVVRTKKRRSSSILKTKQYFNGEHVDTLAEYTVTKSARRVSWAEKPCIKLFETADAAVTVKEAFFAGQDVVDRQDMMLAREEMILSAVEDHSIVTMPMSLCSTFKDHGSLVSSVDENTPGTNVAEQLSAIMKGLPQKDLQASKTHPRTFDLVNAEFFQDNDESTSDLIDMLRMVPRASIKQDIVFNDPTDDLLQPSPNGKIGGIGKNHPISGAVVDALEIDSSSEEKSVNLRVLYNKSLSSKMVEKTTAAEIENDLEIRRTDQIIKETMFTEDDRNPFQGKDLPRTPCAVMTCTAEINVSVQKCRQSFVDKNKTLFEQIVSAPTDEAQNMEGIMIQRSDSDPSNIENIIMKENPAMDLDLPKQEGNQVIPPVTTDEVMEKSYTEKQQACTQILNVSMDIVSVPALENQNLVDKKADPLYVEQHIELVGYTTKPEETEREKPRKKKKTADSSEHVDKDVISTVDAAKEAKRYEIVNILNKENDMLREKIEVWRKKCELRRKQLIELKIE